ncbi:MAG: hypothetical protein SFW64_00515 [Alphaproteobacteria bacterium]|nr:hypothetical protein [Alphaproteobacteria bacterium]
MAPREQKMMGWFKNMFGGAQADQAANFQPQAPATTAPVTTTQAANDAAFDWVDAANMVIGQSLKRLPVRRYGVQNAASLLPLESVSLTGVKPQEGGFAVRMGGAPANTTVTLTMRMKDKVGNYDIDAVNNAIHAVLASVPALTGKVKFAKDISQQSLDHDDIWKQLHSVIQSSGKFSEQEIGLLSEYFEQSKLASAEDTDWSKIEVQHADGKVQVRIRPQSLKGDENEAVSGEARLVAHFNERKDIILPLMRNKVAALNVLTSEELASLDFNAAVTKADWGDQPTIEFGSKTGKEGVLEKTALAKIDTDKIQECFTAAFLEAEKELPSVMGRMADGAMVAQAIRHRLGNNPTVEKALDHAMFKSQKEQKAENESKQDANLVEIGNATETDDPHKLVLTFDLPHGVSLGALRESVVRGQQQIPIMAARNLTQGSAAIAA